MTKNNDNNNNDDDDKNNEIKQTIKMNRGGSGSHINS